MRIAIIDLGTNTFNLLIVDVLGKNNFSNVFRVKTAVKLGEGGIHKNIIAAPAFARGINSLKSYRSIIERFKADKIIAFATSAMRSSANGKKFIEAARKEANIEIDIISGEKEAELIWKGVRMALDIGDNHSLILDIGGGSNEFIIATQNEIAWKQSFDTGVARLLEKFRPSDPITAAEIEKLEMYFRSTLQPLYESLKIYPVKELIGSSGSFDTFAEMVAHKFHHIGILKGKTEFRFDMKEYDEIHKQLVRSDREERSRTPGIIALRVDMIVVGTVFVNFLLREFNISSMRMSTYALKQGVLAEVMKSY